MRSTADLNISLEETSVDSLSLSNWEGEAVGLSEVTSFNSNSSSCILVLDSEGSIDETSTHGNFFWSDINTLLSDAKHLNHHLVMSDMWRDLNSIRHNECVVVVRADVVKSDSVWLFSASTHAEDLVAVWIVEEVLILSSVGHEERKVVSKEWVVAPLIDSVIAKYFRVLEPAPALVLSLFCQPHFEFVISK